ncbi:REP-associated tyrosine transposase [Hymenobacter sp.]|jgi:REP element-mobilizing transposase RayT|uniref:REP-associated tyrosine transposase n=1 Tax=Hymenobacter sp. TaxID=1898978 RepID=UPI002EDA6CE7
MLPPDLTHYQRALPHRLPPGENLFITFRLAGSLPRIVLERMRAHWEMLDVQRTAPEDTYARQRRYFGRFDKLLDSADIGPTWLRMPTVAELVQNALHYYDSKGYQLVCYCLMPNHVHLIVSLPDDARPLARTLQSIKSYTAARANALLGRNGRFWHRESYDHIVRDADEMQRIISYVLENPVKAGLISNWQQWPYTYWHEL